MSLSDKLNQKRKDKIDRILGALNGNALRGSELKRDSSDKITGSDQPSANSNIRDFFSNAKTIRNDEGEFSYLTHTLNLDDSENNKATPLKSGECKFPAHDEIFAPCENLPDVLSHFGALTCDSELQDCSLAPHEVAFLDVECTGLAGGAGTFPFLIGVGTLDEKCKAFTVKQFFMEDYDQERAQLDALEEEISRAKALVTFNGKTFDVPLLRTRYIFHRKNRRLFDMPHADLLHPSRRMWRLRLPACDLKTIEEEIFGIKRVGDIPGALIPQIYFDYVRGLRRKAMIPVITHNVQDIVSMAGLLLHIGEMARLCDTLPSRYCYELLGLAGARIKHGDRAGANACREKALIGLSDRELECKTLFDIGLDYKRLGEFDKAMESFEGSIQIASDSTSQLRAREEQSKILEHRLKRINDARKLVERTLAWIDQQSELHYYIGSGEKGVADISIWRVAFEHRLTRLKRRVKVKK